MTTKKRGTHTIHSRAALAVLFFAVICVVSSCTLRPPRAEGLPVDVVDERYSSVQAQRLLRDTAPRSSRDRGRIDASAAAVILQAYLDARRLG